MPRRVCATGARDDAGAPAAAAPGPADGSAAGSAAGSADGSVAGSADGSAAGSTAGSVAGRPSDGSSAAAGDDTSVAAGRSYPAAGMWRLPGAVPERRRRAPVLQGARLRRVRERGRGDRHVPFLRRGPVAGGLLQRRAIAVAVGLQRRAIAVAGGLLERRGDRARAVAEVGVVRQQ